MAFLIAALIHLLQTVVQFLVSGYRMLSSAISPSTVRKPGFCRREFTAAPRIDHGLAVGRR
jgi:hypothetical protein